MNLKKLTDEELDAERERRSEEHSAINASYWEIKKLEEEEWKKYARSTYEIEDVRVEINRRAKRLRKAMKPFHAFTRGRSNDRWPLLTSKCSCGDGWFAEIQSRWVSGSSVSECEDILHEWELDHLKDVRDDESKLAKGQADGKQDEDADW